MKYGESRIPFRAANPCPALGGLSAYFVDLLDIGGDDFKISYVWILLCPNSCFFYSFSPNFFDGLFLIAKLFLHISCKNSLKPINIYLILHLASPQNSFHDSHTELRSTRNFEAYGTSKRTELRKARNFENVFEALMYLIIPVPIL